METITTVARGKWYEDAASVWDSGITPDYDDIVIIDKDHVIELDGTVVASGTTTKSADNTAFLLGVHADDTTTLNGKYMLLLELVDSERDWYKEAIAEYTVEYKKRRA